MLDGLECGGAYMKLLQDNKKLHAEEFSNASPYIIMFGPDKCGATNKVRNCRIPLKLNLTVCCRYTSFSGTKTRKLASMKRSTLKVLHQQRLPNLLHSILSL